MQITATKRSELSTGFATCHRYQVYGLRLTSNIPLPQLQASTVGEGVGENVGEQNVSFEYVPNADGSGLVDSSAQLVKRFPTTLGDDLALYRQAEEVVLRWEGRYDFSISSDGRTVRCQSMPGQDVAGVRATLYGAILSYVLHVKGTANLHASAVVTPRGALGFMADPGTGKSTLAAACAKAGQPLLTDDLLALEERPEGFIAFPGFASVSLSNLSLGALFQNRAAKGPAPTGEGKRRLVVDGRWARFADTPVPLRGLIVLRRGSARAPTSMERLPRLEAFRSLLDHTNCMSILSIDLLRRQMKFLARLANEIPVWDLSFPTGFTRLEGLVEEVLLATESVA